MTSLGEETTTTKANKNGPLLLACFHVLWMKDCVRAISVAKELATAYPACKFCSVPADTLELQAISRKYKVENFPTFILFRAGEELQRIEGPVRVAENIARMISTHITPEDVAAFELKKKKREEEELQLRAALDPSTSLEIANPSDDGSGQIEWVWDVDGTGSSMRIEELGMQIVLRGTGENDDDQVVWEYCKKEEAMTGGGWLDESESGWTAFSPFLQTEIEKQYLDGKLYKDSCQIEIAVNLEKKVDRGLSIWQHDMSIKSDVVTGLHMEFIDEEDKQKEEEEEDEENYSDDEENDDDDGGGDMVVRRRGPRAVGVVGEPEMSELQKKIDESMAKYRRKEKERKQAMASFQRGRDVEAARGTAGLTPNSGVHRWELIWEHEPARAGEGDSVGLVSENFEKFGPCKEPCLGGDEELCSLALYSSGKVFHGKKLIAQTNYRRSHMPEVEAFPTDSVLRMDDRVEVSVENGRKQIGRIIYVNPNGTFQIMYDEEDDDVSYSKMNFDYGVKAENIFKLPPESNAPAACWGQQSRVAVLFDTDAKGGSGILRFELDGTLLEDVVIESVFNKLGGGALYPAICLCPFPKDGIVVPPPPPTPIVVVAGEESSEAIPPPTKKFPSVLLVGDEEKKKQEHSSEALFTDKKGKKKKKKQKKQKGGKEETSETGDTGNSNEEEIPLERCVWMWETDDGWEQYPKDICLQLETARRNNKQELQVRVLGRPFTVRLVGGSKDSTNPSSEPEQKSDTGETCKVRRHVVSEGLRGQWELLSLKFSASTRPLRGSTALEMLKKVWSGEETMNGRELGLGFLFLYILLQGQLRVKIVSSWSDYGGSSSSSMYGSGYYSQHGNSSGGYSGGYSNYYSSSDKKSSSSHQGSSDSHRFATLLAQLYVDRRSKSVMSSIVNILVRNKQLCTRMPKLKDSRKTKKVPVFNAWTDEREPRSPLADLFNHIIPSLQNLRNKRGTIQFPPRPPYPELAPTDTVCQAQTIPSGLLMGKNRPSSRPAWLRPELTDFACEDRVLESTGLDELANLSVLTMHRVMSTQGSPPLEVEEEDEFFEVLGKFPTQQIVVLFHAKWCSSCINLSPVFRTTAMRTPVIRFIRVDVDECDKLSQQFGVEKLPHTVYLKAGTTRDNFKTNLWGEMTGGGPKWVIELDKMMDQFLPEAEKQALVKFQAELSGVVPPAHEEAMDQAKCMVTNRHDIDLLSTWPGGEIASESVVFQNRKNAVSGELAFDISKHEAAVTAVAESMLQRMKEDVEHHAQFVNAGKTPSLRFLSEDVLALFFHDRANAEPLVKTGKQGVLDVLELLRKSRDQDALMVSQALPLLFKAANHVDISPLVENRNQRIDFLLRRRSGQEPTVWLEFLYGALLSSQSEQDLKRLNPYLTPETVQTIFKLTTTAVLRANRIGHTNRCIAAAIRLDSLLDRLLKLSPDLLEESQFTLLPQVKQSMETLASLLSTKRHYVAQNSAVPGEGKFDPRFMVFEFVWNLCLRKKQFDIVQMFRQNLSLNISKVKQMIMGAGKTTVVAPLLALCLSDGKSLVLSVVPKALLEMSRTLMRETFSSIMNKRIYTLRFDRSTKVHSGMRRTLENARINRGIVVATPTTVKSIMLSYLEALEHLQEARSGSYKYEPVEVVCKRCTELGAVLEIFQNGVMLLDEVDLILHPLKSELNFPKGEKFDLDVSENGERWGLPIHLLDAIFFAQSGRVTSFEARGASFDIIKRLEMVVKEGYQNLSLARLPHITLLNHAFYAQRMKPVLAEWAFLWIQKEHLHGIDREEAVRYMLTGAAARSEGKAKELLLQKELDANTSNDKSRLEQFLKYAQQSQVDTDLLYESQEQLESFLSSSALHISQLDAEIALITQQIKEAENPRDDSLDNAVVVWYSHAFAPSHSALSSASKLASLRALGQLCSELESAGLTVKRCDTAEEAGARVRELQSNGHLRCVVVGGGEGVVGCSQDCDESHQGTCLVCNQGWGSHSGHTCNDGRRGSWPDHDEDNEDGEQDVQALENVDFVKSLFSTVGQVPLPPVRVSLFGGHATLQSSLRLSFWKLGIYVADDEAKLQAWCDQIPDWSSSSSPNKV